jgi:glutaredoxin
MKLPTVLTVAILALVLQGGAGAATAPATPSASTKGNAAAGKPGVAVPQVELYVTSWCPYCKQAEEFFRSQGIPFTSYDIEKDSAAARRKEELDSRGGVPLAIINGQKIHGYSAEAYREALKKQP